MLGSPAGTTATLWGPTTACSPDRWGAAQTRGGGALRQYEVMLILPAEAEESVVSAALDRITRIVSEGDGQLGNVDRWGRRRFAFELDRQHEGYYVVVEFTAPPSVITELERVLHLADEVIRFKVVVRGEAA
ncbi:MAG TPA: 30S ribosomal protein S6 [Actinomycetota bacterium]|nr:30S ribosomal protein S6 [Actinomycetota bacterium]